MRLINILVINGPNLNMLGIREKDVYGLKTYKDLRKFLKCIGKEFNIKIKVVQSNYEGKLIDYLQKAKKYDGIVLNAGAYTHYSYAIFDAIKSIDIPVVEVHLTDIYKREEFRKTSIIKDACIKQVFGLGFDSYKEAIKSLLEVINV